MNFARPCISCGRLVRGRSRCDECEARTYAGSALSPSGSRWAWSHARDAVLKAEPWCRACAATGKRTRATGVHHLVQRSDGGSDHPSNLMPLCDEHHKHMHGKQDRGRGEGSSRLCSPPPTYLALGARTLAKFKSNAQTQEGGDR